MTAASVGADDRARVRALLGREPRCSFTVVVRSSEGAPVVIRNPPLLDDGTPMPTRYWLVGAEEVVAVSRLESTGAVRRAAQAVGPTELADAHRRYANERDGDVPADWPGPRPSGGVGGTRMGVKCLHAHFAWFLAGGDDPVGQWVADQLAWPDGDRPAGGWVADQSARQEPGDPPAERIPTIADAIPPAGGGRSAPSRPRSGPAA